MKIDLPPVRSFDEAAIFPGEEVLDAAVACFRMMLHLTAKFAHDVFDLSHCSVEGLPDRDQRVFALGRVGMGLVDDDLVVLGYRDAKLDLEAAKQEAFWGPVEGRLIAMLEDVPDLTLAVLNEATQAWVEYEYNRKVHSEIGQAPITRFLAGPEVTRPSPDSDTLRLAFTRTDHRMQRKSDGTVVIEGRRFEIPNRYRHLSRIEVRYAGWDLGLVHLVDERTGKALSRLYPQDKTENASGLRRSLDPVSPRPIDVKPATGVAPLLARLIDRQAATGLPPPYLPKDEQGDDT